MTAHQLQLFSPLHFTGTIAGVDEAGRGALAGNVVAAAVILPEGDYPKDLTDSKALSAKRREQLFEWIDANALAVSWGQATPSEIDKYNIHHATLSAMHRAISQLDYPYQHLLIDGKFVPSQWPKAQAIIGGDRLIAAISAASIVAKVIRDRQMVALAKAYPVYGFAAHKGYGSKLHRHALLEHGVCEAHRLSYAPVRRAKEAALNLFAL